MLEGDSATAVVLFAALESEVYMVETLLGIMTAVVLDRLTLVGR